MKKDEAEAVVKLFTELQPCKDKRAAFIKGVLYGMGFANSEKREPNWMIIKSLVNKGKDICNWIDIEKSVGEINRKVWEEQVNLWQLLLEEK